MSNLGDVRQKPVKITLGGQERELRFDMNAFAELEDLYGSIQAGFEALASGKFKPIRTMLWLALLHENPNLTEREVGSWISIGDLAEVASKLTEEFSKSLPQGAEDEDTKADTQNSGN